MFSQYKIIDLTHVLHEGIATWDGKCGYVEKVTKDHADCPGRVKFRGQELMLQGGAGTHLDAPLHCDPTGISIAEIPLEQLTVPVVVIDASLKADANYLISKEDIEIFENKYGLIPNGCLVIGYTGWDRFWDEPVLYRNQDSLGVMSFPSFSIEAVEFLVEARRIAGIGIDTLSPDAPNSEFPVHDILLKSGKYIIENVANASKLPPRGAFVVISPLKLSKGTESPIRLIGFIPLALVDKAVM